MTFTSLGSHESQHSCPHQPTPLILKARLQPSNCLPLRRQPPPIPRCPTSLYAFKILLKHVQNKGKTRNGAQRVTPTCDSALLFISRCITTTKPLSALFDPGLFFFNLTYAKFLTRKVDFVLALLWPSSYQSNSRGQLPLYHQWVMWPTWLLKHPETVPFATWFCLSGLLIWSPLGRILGPGRGMRSPLTRGQSRQNKLS